MRLSPAAKMGRDRRGGYPLNRKVAEPSHARCVAPSPFRGAAGRDHLRPCHLRDVPTATEDVCLSGQTRKVRYTVKTARMTRSGASRWITRSC